MILGGRQLQRNYAFIPPLARAQLALQRGDNAAAVAELQAVLAKRPRMVEAQYLLGATLIQMKQYEKAELALKQAADLSPNSAAPWTDLCYVQDELKKFSEADTSCKKALAIAPKNEAAIDNEASALIGLKRYSEAIAMLEGLTQEDPKMIEGWNDLGQAYAESGRKKDAAAAYSQALKIDPKNEEAQQGLDKLSH
jgi:Flp pilus assembly protein TadD